MEGVFFHAVFLFARYSIFKPGNHFPLFVIFFGLKNRILSEEIKQNKSL